MEIVDVTNTLEDLKMDDENIIDSASTLEILKMDSGLLPKPNEDWKTFVPKEGDVAYVLSDRYVFKNGDWEKQ